MEVVAVAVEQIIIIIKTVTKIPETATAVAAAVAASLAVVVSHVAAVSLAVVVIKTSVITTNTITTVACITIVACITFITSQMNVLAPVHNPVAVDVNRSVAADVLSLAAVAAVVEEDAVVDVDVDLPSLFVVVVLVPVAALHHAAAV